MIAYLRFLREHEQRMAMADIQRATAIRDAEARIVAQEDRADENDRARVAAWKVQDLALMASMATWESNVAKVEEERYAREVEFSNNMEIYMQVRNFLSGSLAFSQTSSFRVCGTPLRQFSLRPLRRCPLASSRCADFLHYSPHTHPNRMG